MPTTYSLRQLGDVCGGDHVCFLCNGAEEKWRVLGEYYRVGLEKNEKMLFFRHSTTAEEIIERLECSMHGIRACVESGQFQVLNYTEIYTLNNVFDPEIMIARLLTMIEKALCDGYSALRVCGDMSWVHNETDLTAKLLKYESQLNSEYPNSFSAICLYDMSKFKPVHLLQVLSTHPQAIIKEKLYQNIYYMPPEEYLGPDLNQAMLTRWMQNIEERKAVEEQLIASTMEAEKAAHAKSSFLATMSHEIRNPTNGIIGSVDMLAQTKITSEQRELIKIIQSSAKHLYRVVNDVLDFSKVESGKFVLTQSTVRVRDLLEDSLRLCQYSIQKNLSVSLRYHSHPDCPEFIVGDETRLRQILVNLIGNACKFTEEGEVVVYVSPVVDVKTIKSEESVEIEDAKKDRGRLNKTREIPNNNNNGNNQKHNIKENNGNQSETMFLEFSVSDSGAGISMKDQSQLFQKFTQLDVTRKWAGTGLGLAICKQLVEAMGGTILVKSVIGHGSTFYFRIPVILPPPSPSIVSPPSLASSDESSFSFSPILSPSSPSSFSFSSSSQNQISSAFSVMSPISPLLIPPDKDYLSSSSSSSMAAMSTSASSSFPIPLSPSNSSSSLPTLSSLSCFSSPISRPHSLSDLTGPTPLSSSSSSFSSLSLSSSSSFSALSVSSIPSPSLSSVSSPSILTTIDQSISSPNLLSSLSHAYDFSDNHVLVVEDDITNQKVLKYMLKKVGCKVTVACNGLEAVRLADTNHYTMILTDQYMPELDGYTAMKQIRERYKMKERECPPVVVCTGTYEARLEEVMDDILIKPVRFRTILDTLVRYCTNKAG